METVSRVKSVLDYLKKYEGLTANDISSKTKISKPTLAMFKSGHGHPRNSTLKKLQKAFPFINNEWLFNGNGEMIIPEKLPSQVNMPAMRKIRLHLGLTQKELSDATSINQGLISHYERTGKNLSKKIYAKLTKAYGNQLDEILKPNKGNSDISTTTSDYNQTSGDDLKKAFGITYNKSVIYTGDAMTPRFNHGDTLLLRQLNKDSIIPYGECFYLEFNEINLFRVIERLEDDTFLLKSINQDYGDLNIHIDNIKTLSLVVGRIESLA